MCKPFETNGLYRDDKTQELYFRLSDYIITSDCISCEKSEDCAQKLNVTEPSKYSRELIISKLRALSDLDNGIVAQALDASLAFILGQFAGKTFPGLIVALIGAPGTFKTTLLKKICFLTRDVQSQFCQFVMQQKYENVVNSLEATLNLPLIVDDILPMFETARKAKMTDLWNHISRVREVPNFKGTMFLTSEKLPPKLLSSSYDRILFLQQRELSADEKNTWYRVINDIPEDMFPGFWLDFIQELLRSQEKVVKDINEFLKCCDDHPDFNHSTRMWDVFRVLMTTRYIFCIYYLGEKIDNPSEFISNYLEKSSFHEQSRRITRTKATEQGLDYIRVLYEALYGTNKGIHILIDRDRYLNLQREFERTGKEFRGIAYSRGDYVYLTADVIEYAVLEVSGVEIEKRQFINQILENSVVYKNAGKSATVTELGKRHYRFSIPRLNAYMEKNYPNYFTNQNTQHIMLEVHRKGGR